MTKRQILIFILVILVLLGVIFQKPLMTHFKIILFISEQFPQISIKPLGLLSKSPTYQRIELDSVNGKIVGDLFTPNPSTDAQGRSALIVAMGIKTTEDDKPLILHFADSLARLGYVVFWPRLEVLDQGQALPEESETFIKAFEYLEKGPFINPERISYMGFSVGSSTAMVASSKSEIRDKVHTLIFFGGYFNIFDYLLSLSTKTFYLGEEKIVWKAAPDAIDHAKGLLEVRGANEILKLFHNKSMEEAENLLKEAPEEEINGLKKYSPSEAVANFKAKIFILHDKSDTYVPYVESIKLSQILPKEQIKAYHISDLFDHVQPNRPINVGELLKLYGFLYKTLSYL